jgi:hypothetical protein
LKALFDLRRHALLREMALDTDGAGMTHDEEATRWQSLYRLFATGDASALPAIRSLERAKAQPAAGPSGA